MLWPSFAKYMTDESLYTEDDLDANTNYVATMFYRKSVIDIIQLLPYKFMCLSIHPL